MTFPQLEGKTSIGTVITIILLVGGGIATIQQLKDSQQQLTAQLTSMEQTINSVRSDVASQLQGIQQEVRSNVQRLDTQITQTNARIDFFSRGQVDAPRQ